MSFHIHHFKVAQESNIIQLDVGDFGLQIPSRLCITECKCGATRQEWKDTHQQEDDLILEWRVKK